ncbi:MAG: STAS domain-containing protein [Pseudomonadota bacterium]
MAEPDLAAIPLPDRLDLSTAPDLAREILKHPADRNLVLDASRVSHLGTLGVQVLIAAARRSRAAGAGMEVKGLSGRAGTQLAALGLTLNTITEAEA